ncbi:tigger transposable element-derived protein 1-like [Macrobrachium rosenbergii]|uniref:tigger transposable element-derived protein 1-like n=1 Tax=Macrobrachium rosenbergii TaxID=79674 RepID=UPI0034D5C32C
MPPKRRAPAKGSSSEPKRKRNMMNISEKVKLLDMLKEGKSYAAVARHYGMNESTVRYIKKEEVKIRKSNEISFNREAKRVITVRNKRIVKMESALALFGLKSVPLYGEAASADTEGARHFVEDVFPKLISDGGYLPEQVLNMDETGLFWKRMPSRTFLFKDEVKRTGFKAHKDCVTLIKCGNAAGFMIKPGLIYKSRNPRALKNKNKALLPVYWMNNSKAWITKALTIEWFLHCFIPQVKL